MYIVFLNVVTLVYMINSDGFLGNDDKGFKPKFGKRVRAEKTPSLSTLRRIRMPSKRKGYYSSVRPTSRPHEFSRRVVVKARIVKMTKNGWDASQAHLKYIERDGVEKEGGKGELFGNEQDFERESLTEKIPGEKRQFRFIISPEDAEYIDLKQFTNDLMGEVEKDLGRELKWGAVCHYNTENPHVHIVIRGIDKDDREVRIDPEYISHGVRARGAEIVERKLGKRHLIELEGQLDKEVTESRVTSLDRNIQKHVENDSVDLGGEDVGKFRRERLHERLKYLQRLGLANHKGGYQWELAENWQEELKSIKVQDDKMKVLNAAEVDVEHRRIFDTGAISGRVADIGLSNELYDRFYMVVETPHSEAYYVEISHRDFERHGIRRGDIISVKSETESWGKPSDKNIQRIAGGNESVYDSAIHRASITGDTVMVDKMTIDADDYVEAHKMRMMSLVRYGLATQLSDTSWAVDPALTERLEMMDREGPKVVKKFGKETSLTVQEQVSYRGNTWLDKHFDGGGEKGYAKVGFGKETREAIGRRAMFLQQELGIESSDQWRTKNLTELEKNDYAETLQKQTGLKYRAATEGGRREGKLSDTGALASGRRYAVIMNEKTQEFSMLPWKKQFDNYQGKQVQIERGSQGRWMMRQISMNRSRGIGR